MPREYKDRKGCKPIHLFNEVWRVGSRTQMKGTKQYHLVIYSPDDKEYHVYGENVERLGGTYLSDWRPDPALIKIYILTSILDSRENWNFNLGKLPAPGQKIKIIYDNGTIKKNMEFEGEWKREKIELKRRYSGHEKDIKPVAWRA